MGKYSDQANIYSFRADLIKEILNTVKTKYRGIYNDKFGASNINGQLSFNYEISSGDYLTGKVIVSLDEGLIAIDKLIQKIDSRVIDIRKRAEELDLAEAINIEEDSSNESNNDNNE